MTRSDCCADAGGTRTFSDQVLPSPHSQTPFISRTQVVRVARQLSLIVSGFSAENQATLRRGLDALYSAFTESMKDASSGSALVWTVVPVASLARFFEMAYQFIWSFIIWHRSFIRRPFARSPGSVVIVDILGDIFVLEADTFSTWEVSLLTHVIAAHRQ